MRESKKAKEARIARIIEKLHKEYGSEPRIFLNFEKPWQLLVAVILSAQCTDERVNIVTKDLFRKYTTIESLAKADLGELEKDINSIGLYKAKSKNIVGMANMLRDVYGYKIPQTREELEKLPGVGRKTANVVLSVGFNIPAIAVDTHVERVAKMFGLAELTDTPLQVEKALMSIFPMESWGKIHHQLIHLGRYKLPARGERTIDPELEKLLVLK